MARNEHKKVLRQLSEAYQNVINEGLAGAMATAGSDAAPTAPTAQGPQAGGHNAEQQQAGAAIKKAYDGGPSAVVRFLNTPEGKDPKVRQFLHKAQEQFDGDAIDDNITVEAPGKVALNQLFPTQNFIDMKKSIAFPLASSAALKKSIIEKTGHGTISISDNAILDGHHRWSGQFAITPDGVINAVNIDLPKGPTEKLAALQLAIGAINPNPEGGHPSETGDPETQILGKSEGEIYKMILAHVGTEMDKKAGGLLLNDDMLRDIIREQDDDILTWLGVKQGQLTTTQEVKEAIARRVANNLSRMQEPATNVPRSDMPQLDHEIIKGDAGLEKIKAGLAAGTLNVVPPFAKQEPAVKESRLRAKDEFKLMSEAYENLRP